MLTPRILVMPVFQRLTAFSQFLLVYFSYADIILGELIIILMVFSYEYVKMNSLLCFVSHFMNYPF